MKLNKTVKSQIESLTNNEDFQQDLWVAHLSGQHHLPSILQSIQKKHTQIEDFQRRLQECAIGNMSLNMTQVLDKFLSVEKSIIYMLLLGYTLEEISDHHGASIVHIRQALSIIQKHNVWNELQTTV